MPQERENQYRMPTATDADEAPGDKAQKAARYVVTRNIKGIPQRAFILGHNDHAPIVKGVHDLTKRVWALLDHLDPEPDAPSILDRQTLDLIEEVRVVLEDHGCPEEVTEE